MTSNAKLDLWQKRLSKNSSAFADEQAKMDKRERLYRGERKITAQVRDETKEWTPHVRNVCREMIESMIDSSIPQPKVTARKPQNEWKARIIENLIRNELDRLPFEAMNDLLERVIPIQGGACFLVEWDNTLGSHDRLGEMVVSAIHPKQIVPQDGVYSGIEDMDYVILRVPQTKNYIERKYGKNVEDQTESEPDVKDVEGSTAEDMVTQYIAYYRNDNGGIGIYSWVNDTELEDIEDYQARHLRHCANCGAVEPLQPSPDKRDGTCPQCGGDKWVSAVEDYEEIYNPIYRTDGTTIPGAELVETINDFGMPAVKKEPTRVPFYKPDIYPLILQKNVSTYGKFLGDSDIDAITDQQNTINRVEAKIIDKLIQSGSYLSLPDDASIAVDATDMKVIRPGNAANKALIDVYDLQGNVVPDLNYLSQVYEETKQATGVTDSFLGRVDRTATSGRAKEFSAAQAAGRLESKRIMKQFAYSQLFEAIFKFHLAYADEPRLLQGEDNNADTEYSTFNRYDFLEQDEAGEWYWDDDYMFSTDTAATLAGNREAMWQETRGNFQSGAFGDPTNIDTLILFWAKMERLHYPDAAQTKAWLEDKKEEQLQREQMMMQMQQAQQQAAQQQAMEQQVVAQAQADAARDMGQPPQGLNIPQEGAMTNG